MSYAAQTPQRPLPGGFPQTSASGRYQTGTSRPTFPRAGSNPAFQQPQNVPQNAPQQSVQSSQQNGQVAVKSKTRTLDPIARASKTVDETLDQESRYPELDTYLGRKCPKHPNLFLRLVS